MARFGNTGASSLLSAASSAANSIATYNDSLASLEWDQSAKTQGDLSKYEAYLQGRLKTVQTNDPAKALTLTRTIDSARRSYTSNEIARASQDIQTGNGTSQDKLGRIADLYGAAVQNGDMQLAQQLFGQYNTTQLSIQNQAITAQNQAEAANTKYQSQSSSGYLARIGDMKDQIKAIDDQFKKTGNMTPMQQNGQPFKDPTGKPFSMNGLKAVLYGQINSIAQEAQGAGLDPEHFRSIATAANDALQSSDYQTAIKNLNFEATGQKPQTAEVTGYDEHGRPVYGTKDNPQIGIQANQQGGQFQFEPILNTQGVTSTDLLKQNGGNKLKQIEDSLKTDGVNYNVNSDGTVSIFDPQSQQYVRATIDPSNGNLRYTSTDKGGNVYEKQVTIDSNSNRQKNANPFSDVSYQQLQSEQQAQQVAQDPAYQKAQAEAGKVSGKSLGIKDNAYTRAAGSAIGGLLLPAGGFGSAAGNLVPTLLGLSNKAAQDRATAAANAAAAQAAATQLQARSTAALSAIPRANPSLPVSYNPANHSLQGAVGSVFPVPAATQQAAFQPGTQGFANTFLPATARSYLIPYQTQLAANHFAIINNGTNYGGTVQSLRDAGVTDAMFHAPNSPYDAALRAAYSNGQFK